MSSALVVSSRDPLASRRAIIPVCELLLAVRASGAWLSISRLILTCFTTYQAPQLQQQQGVDQQLTCSESLKHGFAWLK